MASDDVGRQDAAWAVHTGVSQVSGGMEDRPRPHVGGGVRHVAPASCRLSRGRPRPRRGGREPALSEAEGTPRRTAAGRRRYNARFTSLLLVLACLRGEFPSAVALLRCGRLLRIRPPRFGQLAAVARARAPAPHGPCLCPSL